MCLHTNLSCHLSSSLWQPTRPSLTHTHIHFLMLPPFLLHPLFYVPHRSMCVTLVFSTKGLRYLRVGLAVPLFGSLSCLRAMVAQEGNISPDQVHKQTQTHTYAGTDISYPSRIKLCCLTCWKNLNFSFKL